MTETEHLRKAIEAIRDATLKGIVCDDVAWFSLGETLHDYCTRVLEESPDQMTFLPGLFDHLRTLPRETPFTLVLRNDGGWSIKSPPSPQPVDELREQDTDEYNAMIAVMEKIDPANVPCLTANQRASLGRFAKPYGSVEPFYPSPPAPPAPPDVVEALREMIYETTHLSPLEDDGSHWCRITKPTLERARAALASMGTTDDDK